MEKATDASCFALFLSCKKEKLSHKCKHRLVFPRSNVASFERSFDPQPIITMAPITPEAPALTALITKIKEAEPGLGIKKVLSQIQAQEPTWLVSEKRVKKLMSEAGIATAAVELEVDESVPVSHIDTTVDVGTLTSGLVKAKMINKVIGKGMKRLFFFINSN